MNDREYLKEGLDLKRLVLYFQKRIWIVLLLIVLGGGIGALIYQVVRSISMPVQFDAVSKLYISFAYDESGEMYQHYNGYTWNELLDSDPIMDCIMHNLPGYDREEVMGSTKAEILSDIRLLTVTISGDNEKFVREVQSAVELGLQEYAATAEELRTIKTVRQIPPRRVYWVDRTTSSCVLGAVIMGMIGMLVYSIMFILNESIYVQSDIEKRYPGYKALGITTRNRKGLQPYNRELKSSILHVLGDNRNLVLIDIDDHAPLRAQDFEKLLNWKEGGSMGSEEDNIGDIVWHVRSNDEEEDELFETREKGEWDIIPLNGSELGEKECRLIKDNNGVVILVPFGSSGAVRRIDRVLSLLKNHDLNIYGMIIEEADEEYLNRYFG